MSTTPSMDELAGQILSELRDWPEDSRVGDGLMNAVVDAMVQANIDLTTVSLREVKNLVTHLYRGGSPRTADCLPLVAF